MKSKRRIIAWLCFLTMVLGTFLTSIGLPEPAQAVGGPNLAIGKAVTASSSTSAPYTEANINDSNQATYWESANNALPQWIQVDLGSTVMIDQIVMKLPSGWEARTQTLSIQGSTDGTTFSNMVNSAGYTFDPASGNTVTVNFAAVNTRYVRLNVTANTVWPAGQFSEVEVYGAGGGPVVIPGKIEAENYSAMSGIQTETTSDTGGGLNVGWIDDGDWLDYSINVQAAGSYTVEYRVASPNTTGQIQLRSDATTLAATAVPNTGGWQTWQTVTATVNLSAGQQTLRVYAGGGGFNLNWIHFVQGGGDPQPPTAPANLALNKPVTASSNTQNFVAANATDGSTSTYWEGAGGSYPNTLTADLGANASVTSVVVKLNPDSIWSTRTQTIQVLGHDQNSTVFNNLVGATVYTFDPATGNKVTIPVTATVSAVQLKFTSNSGAPAGQAAEFEVIGTPASNPDLTITGMSWSPASPSETDAVTLTSTVKNIGTAASAATTVNFYLGTTKVGSASVAALAAGASAGVSATIGAQNAGTYSVSSKVDEDNTVIEMNETNNSFTNPASMTVNPVSSSDLVATTSWTPSNPSAGNTVTFTINLKNQGNIASSSGAHAITLVLKNAAGTTIQTFNGSYTGTLAAGASANVTIGTWTAVNGSYTVTTTVAADANEVASKQGNNTSTTSLYSGRGANMPFTILEAEASSNSTNGTRLAPNFLPGDFAGEASGRSAVYLDTTGKYVEFTLTSPANALVLRNAIAENTTGTISIYVNGVDKGNFTVTSKYSYVYATPDTLGQLGYNNSGTKAYWLYEDAQLMLDQVYPADTKIRIQKDSGDVPWIYVDLLETENVAPPASNPDPAKYVEVSGTKSIEQALTEFRQDTTKKGIFIPAGQWTISSKVFLYGRATEIIGAGPWYTKLTAPQDQTNTDVGFNISSSANGSIIKNLSAWGNYVYRVDGPGKFIDGNGMQNVTVENIWAEHFICLYWGVNSSYNTFRNNRIKNTFADGINMTNGSSYNIIDNNYARATGDDAFALFSAIDAGGSFNAGNKYTNLTAVNVRRAAAFAVYGGQDNLFQNLYGADTLTYPGLTVSSLSFGYNTLGFGDKDTVIDGVTLDRTGGDFWTSAGADDKINNYQNFGAIWFFGGDRDFKNIWVKNVDINNPVYFGLMFQSKYPEALPMTNVRVENVNINNATRYGIKLVVKAEDGQGPAVGSASFTNVRVNNPGITAIYGQDKCPGFTIVKVSGNNW